MSVRQYVKPIRAETSNARNPGMSLFYGGEATQSNRRVALSAQCTGLVHSEEMHSAHGMQVFSGRVRYRSRLA